MRGITGCVLLFVGQDRQLAVIKIVPISGRGIKDPEIVVGQERAVAGIGAGCLNPIPTLGYTGKGQAQFTLAVGCARLRWDRVALWRLIPVVADDTHGDLFAAGRRAIVIAANQIHLHCFARGIAPLSRRDSQRKAIPVDLHLLRATYW